MATAKDIPSQFADIEQKPAIDYSESLKDAHHGGEKAGIFDEAGADYSGAVKKTSKQEIALVRKLDWRIMPTLWSMYFLNYVCFCSARTPLFAC